MICSSDNKSSVTVAENWRTFVSYKRNILCILSSKWYVSQLASCFEKIRKLYGLERKVKSIFLYEINLVYVNFKKFFFKAAGADLVQVATCFQVCLHCSSVSSLRTAVGLNFRSYISFYKSWFRLKLTQGLIWKSGIKKQFHKQC